MSLVPPWSHDKLLTLARKVEAAARDADRTRLEAASQRLFDALVEHVGTERLTLLHLPPGERRLLARGQQRVIDTLVDLTRAAEELETKRWAALAEELRAELTLQADEERHALARRLAAPDSTADGVRVTAPLRQEHADFLPHLEQLDALAAELSSWSDQTAPHLAGAVEFLQKQLLPHARAEEAVLYPRFEEATGAPGATDTMKADHREIARRVDALAFLVGGVASTAPPAYRLEQLRAQLYGLGAILLLHFRKEEELVLPILDATLSGEQGQAMRAEMTALAHAGKRQ